MTHSSSFRKYAGMALGLCLMAALAACASGRHQERGQDGKPVVPKVVAPTTQQELKNLPKGLRPDTKSVSHTGGQ